MKKLPIVAMLILVVGLMALVPGVATGDHVGSHTTPCNASDTVGGGTLGNSPGAGLGWDVGTGQCNGSFTVASDADFEDGAIELGLRAEQRRVGQVTRVGLNDYEVQTGQDPTQNNRVWWNFQGSIAYNGDISKLDTLTLKIRTDVGPNLPMLPVFNLQLLRPFIDARVSPSTISFTELYQFSANPEFFPWFSLGATPDIDANPTGSFYSDAPGAWRFTLTAVKDGEVAEVSICIHTPASACIAVTDCTFTIDDDTMTLDSDCTTDTTITVPDGFTLDGDGHSITAVDPAGGHFHGAVVANAGTTAHVTNLTVMASGLFNHCDAGAERLRGILFVGASGSITHNKVLNINQGASGCQEGNAIEVRNAPFDGTHPNTQSVEIAHNQLKDWQKTGIVANGDVSVSITHNLIGESATQANLAANSIQVGFGATGSVVQNNVEGNQWLGASNFGASAILIVLANGVMVSKNNIRGNSDVGLWAVLSNNGTYDNNKVFDFGADGPHGDFGIADQGAGNTFTNNKIGGFDTPIFGFDQDDNKIVAGPQKP